MGSELGRILLAKLWAVKRQITAKMLATCPQWGAVVVRSDSCAFATKWLTVVGQQITVEIGVPWLRPTCGG